MLSDICWGRANLKGKDAAEVISLSSESLISPLMPPLTVLLAELLSEWDIKIDRMTFGETETLQTFLESCGVNPANQVKFQPR